MIDKQELRNKAYMAAFICCGNTTTGGEYAGQVERICCGDPDETGDDVSIPAVDLIALLDELEACKADLRKAQDDADRTGHNRDMWKGQCAQQARQLERHVPLYEAINKAADKLPDGWEICLRVERDGGGVEVVGPQGEIYTDFPTDNERMDYTVCDALEYAIEQDQAMGGKDG